MSSINNTAILSLPYVAARPSVAAWLKAKAEGCETAWGRHATAQAAARWEGLMTPTKTGFPQWEKQLAEKFRWQQATGWWPDAVFHDEEGSFPVKFPPVRRWKRTRTDCDPADLGFAFWSTADRSYHDDVARNKEAIKASMKAAYTQTALPLYRGAWLKDHLRPGEVVNQASVACFTTVCNYAHQISSRGAGRHRYHYILMLPAGSMACSMDALHRQPMGESEWRLAPNTRLEVLETWTDEFTGTTTATVRVVEEQWADRDLPYDRGSLSPEEILLKEEEDLLDWEEDLLAMAK